MNLNTKTKKRKRNFEIVKWTIVVILLITAIFGGHFYRDLITLPLRMLAIVILIATAGSVALLTKKGKAIVLFIREARTEIRKVIWPTRKETLYTTLIVIVFTSVISLILWGLDSILIRLVSFFLP